MQPMLHHTEGARAQVVCAVPGTDDQTRNLPCEVVALVSADDRDYRINVKLESGRVIGPCAPECVIPA